MEEEVKRRMREVLRVKSTNPTQLSNQFKVNQKTLNSHINGDTAVSLSTILLILRAFPDVSAEWLLRGEGEMFLGEMGVCSDNKYFDMCKLLLENREKDIELYSQLADMMTK